MVKLLRNRVRAFTLFETVITLAIVTAILSIGWLNFSVIKEKMLIDSASMQVIRHYDELVLLINFI